MQEQPMQAPKFRWEWNLNTIAVLVTFAAGFVAWGYAVSEMKTGIANIDKLETRIVFLETTSRRLENHEMRIGTVEKQSNDGALALRAVETSINSLASDMRLTREILERLEKAQAMRRN